MSVETNSHNYTNMNLIFSQFVAANFFKKESRSPRGSPPSPPPRAGETVAPPPLPQKNSGGAHHLRFRLLDLCIRFGKIISRACPVGSRSDSFGVCEGFNSGAMKHSLKFKKTKIVATIGPATENLKSMTALAKAGM